MFEEGRLKDNDRKKRKKECLKNIMYEWMDTRNSGQVSALEGFWNGLATARKEKDIILIVCASATYWMMNNIVDAKGGLHNRLTGHIHLKPFTLNGCEEFLIERKIKLTPPK